MTSASHESPSAGPAYGDKQSWERQLKFSWHALTPTPDACRGLRFQNVPENLADSAPAAEVLPCSSLGAAGSPPAIPKPEKSVPPLLVKGAMPPVVFA